MPLRTTHPNPSSPATEHDIREWHARLDSPLINAYDVLNIRREDVFHADIDATIRSQFRALSLAFHPDKHPSATAEMKRMCNEVFQKVKEAKDSVDTEARRRDYNVTLGLDQHLGDARAGLPGSINATLLRGAYGRVLEAITKVRSFDLKLPKIVVVGSESSGKSSTLERLAMRSAFPRAEDFCTRMPICMKLRFRRHENVVSIKHVRGGQTLDGPHRIEVPDNPVRGATQDVVDSEVVAQRIRQFILNRNPNDTGRSIITDEEIEIEIRAPNVPDLDLIDLPGIVAAPLAANEASRQCTKRYLTDPNCLILCVLSARVDTLRGSPILELMERVARESPGARLWERTTLVLSKVDQQPSRLEARLVPGEGELQDINAHSIVPVINRSAAEHGVCLPEALERERSWFREWCAQRERFEQEDMGIDGLLKHLDRLMNTHIQSTWVPQETSRLDGMLTEVRSKLSRLGTDPAELDVALLLEAVQSRAVTISAGELCMRCSNLNRDTMGWTDWPRPQPSSSQRQLDLDTIAGKVRAPIGKIPGLVDNSLGPQWRALDAMLAEKLPNGVRDTALAVLRSAMQGTDPPYNLKRFAALREALVQRARESRFLDQAIQGARTDLRAWMVGRFWSDTTRSEFMHRDHHWDHFSSTLQDYVINMCILPLLADEHEELFSPAALAEHVVEDETTAHQRDGLATTEADILAAIQVLQEVATAAADGPPPQ